MRESIDSVEVIGPHENPYKIKVTGQNFNEDARFSLKDKNGNEYIEDDQNVKYVGDLGDPDHIIVMEFSKPSTCTTYYDVFVYFTDSGTFKLVAKDGITL